MSHFWEGKRVLVTGAGGFIGSDLVETLLQLGAEVRAFVRYTSRRDPGMLRQLGPEAFSRIEILAGDLRDEDAIRQAVRGCQVVFHLGALISIPYSYLHPLEVASTNVMGTVNVLTACRDLGVGRVVHTSTSEVYGTARQVPIHEGNPLSPAWPRVPARQPIQNQPHPHPPLLRSQSAMSICSPCASFTNRSRESF